MLSNDVKEFLINFAIVSVTSSVAKTLTAPIDRIKLILQNQGSALQVLTGERKTYKGILDCLIRIPQEQGFWSFWRGNWTNLLRYFPTQALNFAFNDAFKKLYFRNIESHSETSVMLIKLLAGGTAGACTTTIMFPLEFCQTRLAVDMGAGRKKKNQKVKREFAGLLDCVRKIMASEGITGIYRAYPMAVVGISVYRALYFGVFDSIKSYWSHETGHEEGFTPPILLDLLFAQSATCFAGIVAYPFDTVSRRMMLDTGRPKHMRVFTSPFTVVRTLYRKEGIRSFYKGGMTNCLRGVSGALVLVFYDEILAYTNWKQLISSPCDNC